jgi:glutathione S-transferase
MGKVPRSSTATLSSPRRRRSAAYLADEFPRAKLNVPVGDPRRGVYLKWLFFGRAASSRR